MLICTACYPVLVLFPTEPSLASAAPRRHQNTNGKKTRTLPSFVSSTEDELRTHQTVAIMTQPFDGGCDRLATGRPSESRC